MQDLIELEELGWQALSSAGDIAREFYDSLLTDDAVMVFPGGMVIEGKENILQSIISVQPWKFFKIEAIRIISISETVKAVVYKVTAKRESSSIYTATINSTYAYLEENWKLIIHQQTPV